MTPLAAQLEALGARLNALDDPDFAERVGARLAAGRQPRRAHRGRVLVLAALATVLVALLVPAPRHAVARWFGIGAVEITRTEASRLPADASVRFDLGAPAPIDEAAASSSFTVVLPADLGRPSAAYVGGPIAAAVTFAWAPSDRLPAVRETGIGLLLTEVPGSFDRPLLNKAIGPGTSLETVSVAGRTAYWLSGAPHQLFYLDGAGHGADDTFRLATNTLLWERDGVTLRLESGLDRDAAIALAEAMVPAQ